MGSMLPYIAAPWILWVWFKKTMVKEKNEYLKRYIHRYRYILPPNLKNHLI